MRPKLILLLENDLNLRQSIMLILQRAGYFVTATDCIFTALELMRTRNYQLIMVDSNMPEARNVFLPKVHIGYPYQSILILTDQSNSEMEMEDKLQRVHYLVEPVAPERLLDCVGSIMKKNGFVNHPNLKIKPIIGD